MHHLSVGLRSEDYEQLKGPRTEELFRVNFDSFSAGSAGGCRRALQRLVGWLQANGLQHLIKVCPPWLDVSGRLLSLWLGDEKAASRGGSQDGGSMALSLRSSITCFCRVGLALLQPLHTVRRTVSPLPADLSEALSGLRMLVDLMPPRSIQVMQSLDPPTVIFTDASYEAGAGALGVVIKRPGLPMLWTACDCPEWVLDAFREVDRHKAQYIGQLELLAAVLAYTTFPEELRGRHVIHWVDNESAVYGLVKGYSGSPDSARIVNLYHACVTQLNVTPWVEYVHTDDNLADLPSRGDYLLLQVLGGSQAYRPTAIPPVRSLTGLLLPLLAAASPT